MKKKKYFLTVLIFLFMLSGVFVSCENVNWFADLMQDVAKELSVTFTFNKPDASGEVLTKSYIIGKNPTASEMINDTQQYLLQNLAEHAVVHAFECNTKNSDGSYPDGVIVGADDTVESVSVTMPLTFTPVIHYKYKVEYLFESLTDDVDPICEYTGWFDGVEGTSLNILDSQYDKQFDGFTLDNNSIHFSPSTISSTEIATGQKKYIRNEYNITFNANGGAFPSGQVNPIPYKFGEPINESSFPHPHREHYRLAGWTPQVPATMPAEDLDLTAMWEGEPQNINYYMLDRISNSADCEPMLANYADFPDKHIPGVNTVLPDPEIGLYSGSDNVMYFAGWYLKPNGDENFKLETNSDGKYFIPATQEDEVTLYAKWLPKYVYVKPNASSSGTGFESESSVKTIDEAKTLMTGNPYGEEIRVLGSLTDANDIDKLTGTYGNGCGFGVDGNGVKIIAQAYPLINFGSTINITLENVYIDGDASFVNSNDIMNTVDKKTAKTDPLIKMNNSNLTLTNCEITNCDYNGSESLIKAASLTINGTTINYCRARNGDARVPICEISKVQGNVTVDSYGIISNCDGIAISEQEDKQGLSFWGTISNCYEGIVHNCNNSSATIYGTIENCTSYPLQVTKNNYIYTNYSISLNSSVIQDNGKPVIVGKETYVVINSATVKNNGDENLILNDEESSIFLSTYSTNIDHIHYNKAGAYIRVREPYTTPRAYDLTFNNVESFIGKVIIKDTGNGSSNANIISTRTSFKLPSGYAITDDGVFVKAVNPQIVINNPSTVTEYILGEFIDKSAKISDDAKVRIKITNDAYNNIENWGGSSTEKYVMYQIGGYDNDCYKALICHDDTNNYYYADLIFKDAVNTETSVSSGRALDDTDIGYKEISVFVTTDPSVQTTTSVTGISEYIFIHK